MQSDLAEIAVYPKRWLILAAFCFITLLANFGSKSFTVANQIYAAYLDVDLVLLDWATLAMNFGVVIITPIFSWLFFKKAAGFRILSITGASCLLISYFVIALTIQFPNLYPLMFLSNLLQGVALAVGITVSPSFAVVWFPDNQVGLAIASDLLCQNLGIIMGTILPPVFLNQPDAVDCFINTTCTELFGQNNTLHQKTRDTMLLFYTPCIAVLLILLIIFIALITDQPLKPPTYAMLVKRNQNHTSSSTGNFSQFLEEVKMLHQDVNFILCVVALSIPYNLIVVFYLHITVIVEHFDISAMNIGISNDIIGGLLIASYSLSNSVFGFVSAKILNYWKKYVLQVLLGSMLIFFSLTGATLAYYYHNFVSFCVGIFLYSIGTRLVVIPLLEVITRHTYPIDETFVSVWVGGHQSFILILIGELSRIISIYSTSIALLIFMCACGFILFVIALIINPNDKRREIDEKQQKQISFADDESLSSLLTNS